MSRKWSLGGPGFGNRGASPRAVMISIKNGVPDPLKPRLKRNQFVCWMNEDDRDYWIKFLSNAWPFKGASEMIFAEALEPTKWFKVASKLDPNQEKSHKYAIKRDPSDPDPPPDGPDVIIEGT